VRVYVRACMRVCVCVRAHVCLCVFPAAPQMLQWCAWHCAGVAFAETVREDVLLLLLFPVC
jgi:hypothetical protein